MDGPYKFTVSLPNSTASAILQFDFLTQPLIPAPGGAGSLSNFAQFKAGIPYHFTLDYLNLGGGDAAIEVQGETIPQGPLSQLVLYPAASVVRYNRAETLLSKTFQLIQGFGLDEAEVVYLISYAADFGGLNFNALPTQVSDDSPSKATNLFGRFLRLANYGNLRKGPAGGTDGLITIFQNARQFIPATVNQPRATGDSELLPTHRQSDATGSRNDSDRNHPAMGPQRFWHEYGGYGSGSPDSVYRGASG